MSAGRPAVARKKNITVKKGLDDWVMTYGDLMSLLLTFFVLIVSFSSTQESKFDQAANSLHAAFGVLASAKSVINFNEPLVPPNQAAKMEIDPDADVVYEVREVEKLILEAGLDKQVEVEIRDDGVLFRLNAPFLFESGGAKLSAAPKSLLSEMSGFFTKYPYEIEIGGHTDDIPIGSAKFPSNWELSAARAVTVARYFQSIGMSPARIAATGYGEFHPIADNATAEGRENNRRVEIFLHLKQADLEKKTALPFNESPIPIDTSAADKPAEKPPVRQIINPVTGKLGVLPINK
ncbi:MAG: chemotaxis protein MotB [Candidatus Krumholzibacteriia bacterium]|jgi:chemotaxis protein MotB